MSEGQSQRLVVSSAQHRQEVKVATTAMATRAAGLAMAELAAARAKVEAAAAAAELEALRTSSIGSYVSADEDRDNELKLVREAAREQAAQWAAVHPQGRRGGSPDRHGRSGRGRAQRPCPRRRRQPRQARTRRRLG
jgi:hypothetical protein